MSDLEDTLVWQLRAVGIEAPLRQHQFAASLGRKWRFDLAWDARLVAVEVQGGLWSKGAHVQPMHLEREYEKLATAASLGWRVLPVHAKMIESGEALRLIERALA